MVLPIYIEIFRLFSFFRLVLITIIFDLTLSLIFSRTDATKIHGHSDPYLEVKRFQCVVDTDGSHRHEVLITIVFVHESVTDYARERMIREKNGAVLTWSDY